jgi:hypothetical protein
VLSRTTTRGDVSIERTPDSEADEAADIVTAADAVLQYMPTRERITITRGENI